MSGGLRALWFVAITVAVPACLHATQVIGQYDLATASEMSAGRFFGELIVISAVLFVATVLPWSWWLGRRRGASRRDDAIAAVALAAAVLLALHVHLTSYAPFYGNTWARWEPTLGLFLPQWPWLLTAALASGALEFAAAARRRRSAGGGAALAHRGPA